MRKLLTGLVLVLVLGTLGAIGAQASGDHNAHNGRVHQVTVPEADRFTPFALQVRAGDSVRWVNNDEDDHFVVSDDAFNTAGNKGANRLLTADGGSTVLRFRHPGTFVYYCKLHAKLDELNQPVAPGPDGGIQDASGNFGTPMSGVITVVPRHDD